MNTFFALLVEYETTQIPVEIVAAKMWGMDRRKALAAARAHRLPVPAFRGSESQKSAWLISAQDLADYIDAKRSEAKTLWDNVNDR